VSGLVVNEWRRYCHDRLYVHDAATDHRVAVYDRITGKLNLIDEEREPEVLRALRPFLAGSLPPPLAHQLLAEVPAPDEDLTRNKPGAAVSARARELGPHGFQRFVARLLGLRTAATSWEVGAKGERIVGARLERLKRDGWGVLASVELRTGSDIDHVVIGPPGVFTINTKHHKGARIRVGDHVVWVNGFEQQHYIRNSLHEASSAARRLTRACGMPVAVTPMLAFVGAVELAVISDGSGVMVGHGEKVDRLLRSLPGVLTLREREHVLSVARSKAVWLA
jgi:hypothetical protein